MCTKTSPFKIPTNREDEEPGSHNSLLLPVCKMIWLKNNCAT